MIASTNPTVAAKAPPRVMFFLEINTITTSPRIETMSITVALPQAVSMSSKATTIAAILSDID